MSTADTLSRANEMLGKVSDCTSPLHVDALLDAVSSLVQDCSPSSVRKNPNFKGFVDRYEELKEFIRRQRINKGDFQEVKVIGRGAYGKVSVVRHKETGGVFAMKELSKAEMVEKGESACILEERQIMSHAGSEWIVGLHYSFQDYDRLYMVMEYVPGGNLLKIMDDYELTEKWAKFYIAEVVLALSVVHGMGYAHRDVKPENILIDRTGHVKLADFGTCARLGADGLVTSSTAVGTPDYISPEVLQSESQATKYGVECDYWSVGVLLYEILFSDTPFYAESLVGTYAKIMDHRRSLRFPSDVEITQEGRDIISALLTSPKNRLGRNGINDVKGHPFFRGTDWENIRSATPPVLPEVSGEVDTRYFDEVVDDAPLARMQLPKEFRGYNIPFIGFTYNADLKLKAHCFRRGQDDSKKKERDRQEAQQREADYLKRIEGLQGELSESRLLLAEAQERVQLLSGDMEKITTRVASLAAENDKMRLKLSSLRDSSLVEQDQVDSLSKQVANYKETITKLQKELESTTAKQNREAQMNGTLGSSLVEAQQKLMENEIILMSARSQMKLACQEKEELLGDRHNLQESVRRVNHELVVLKESNDLLLAENENLTMELERLGDELSVAKSSGVREMSETELSDMQNKYNSLQEKCVGYENTFRQLKVLSASEKARRVVNVREIEDLRATVEAREEECSRVKRELFECRNMINELKMEVGISQRKLTTSEMALERGNAVLAGKEERIREMESEGRNWEMEVMGKNEVILSMERTEVSIRQMLAKREEELEEARGAVEEAEEEVRRRRGAAEKERKELRREVERLQKERDEADRRCGEAEGRLRGEEARWEGLGKENRELAEKYEQLERAFKTERVKKEQVINKLAEVSHLRQGGVGKKGGSAEAKLKKKEMEYKRLEQELVKMRERFAGECNALRKRCEELQSEKNNLELELSSSKTLSLPARIEASSVGSLDAEAFREGVLYLPSKNIKRHGWNRRRAILTDDKMSFFPEKEAVAEMVIDVGKMYHACAVKHHDLYRAKESELPRILQIMFANEGVLRKDAGSFRSMASGEKTSGMTFYLGHEMVAIAYRKGDATCDVCHKGMSSLFNPAPALHCRICNAKVHKEHVDTEEYHTHCSGANARNLDVTNLFVLAPSVEEQQKWIKTLSRLIKERGYVKSDKSSLI